MKIGFIQGQFYKFKQGGAEIQVSLLIEEFLKKGHEVFYICYGDKDELERQVLENGLHLYRVKKPYRGVKPLMSLRRKTVEKILEEEKPDILYQRGDCHFWDIIPNYGKRKKIPVISSISMERHCRKNKPRIGIHYLIDILTECYSI